MSELSSDVQAVVEAGRAADEPSQADKARLRGRLAAELGAGVFATAAVGAGLREAAQPNEHAASLTHLASQHGALKLLAVLGAVGALVAATWWALPSDREPASAHPTRASRAAVAGPTEQAPQVDAPRTHDDVPVVVEPLATPSPARPKPRRTSKPAPRASAATTPETPAAEDSLQAETALLARAQRALRARDTDEALRVVATHRAQFPAGTLRVEHHGVEALAHCLRGETTHPAVRAFVREAPSSPLMHRLREECKLP